MWLKSKIDLDFQVFIILEIHRFDCCVYSRFQVGLQRQKANHFTVCTVSFPIIWALQVTLNTGYGIIFGTFETILKRVTRFWIISRSWLLEDYRESLGVTLAAKITTVPCSGKLRQQLIVGFCQDPDVPFHGWVSIHYFCRYYFVGAYW